MWHTCRCMRIRKRITLTLLYMEVSLTWSVLCYLILFFFSFSWNVYLLWDASLIDYFSLKQIISEPTHFSPPGVPSIIDLDFIQSSLQSSFSILPTVTVFISFYSLSSISNVPYKKVWLYHKANFNSINELFMSTPWDLYIFRFEFIMEHFQRLFSLPYKSLCSYQVSFLRSLISEIWKHQNLFKHAKKYNSSTSYRSLSNEISSDIKSLNSSFFCPNDFLCLTDEIVSLINP